jgi:outer membrane protein TolC
MKKNLAVIALSLAFLSAAAQEGSKLTIFRCYEEAIKNYPAARQRELLKQSHDQTMEKLEADYLPQAVVNAQATYQSEVVAIPIDLPFITIPELKKDMYKVTLDATQLIYDGGMIKKQKGLEDINLKIDQKNVDKELYALKDRVNQLYFSVLMLRKKGEILEIARKDLGLKLQTLEAGIQNGVMMKKDADVLRAEVLKLEQQIADNNLSVGAALAMLGGLMSAEIASEAVLEVPAISVNVMEFQKKRIEYELFDLNRAKLEAGKGLIASRYTPRLAGFGQAGYGRPGLNMLSPDFEPFYLVGARLTWNVWDWNKGKKDRQILELNKGLVESQQETFEKNLRIILESKKAEIIKYETLIPADEEIIRIRADIARAASSQLDNGVITSTEYVAQVNAEAQARIDLEMHKIQLVRAKFDYLSTTGEL